MTLQISALIEKVPSQKWNYDGRVSLQMQDCFEVTLNTIKLILLVRFPPTKYGPHEALKSINLFVLNQSDYYLLAIRW